MTQGDVFIYYHAFPYSIKGVTTPNSDGTFTIYINSRLPLAQQQTALRHELSHVRQNHFYDCAEVAENEQLADGDRSGIPAEALLFARGGGLVTGARRQHMLSLLDATVDTVFARLAQRQNVSGL